MKYRIRDVNTDEIVAPSFCDLSFNYFMGTDGLIYDDDFEPIGHFNPEMEVADGVYEGDYLLHYDSYRKPSIYKVGISKTIEFVSGCFSSERLPELNCNNFEVIKCR